MFKFIPRSLTEDKGMLRLEPGPMGQALKQTLHLPGSCGCHILDREAQEQAGCMGMGGGGG